jgi:hypothetical protein
VAFVVFGLWFPVALYVLRRAVDRVQAEQDAIQVE